MRYEKKLTQNIETIIKVAIMLTIGIIFLIGQAANAQQMIIDDAAVTTERSFQIETWAGSHEAIFQPAVALTGWLEFAPGLAFSNSDDFEFAGFFAELKAVNRDIEVYGSAIGLVTAFGFNDGGNFEEFMTYVPYSHMFLNDSSIIHLNAGFILADHGKDWEFTPIYGIRGDFGIHERVTLLGEIFADETDFGFNGGVRLGLIPGLLEMDITYGRGFESGYDFPGFNVGIAFTPDSLW
jgi:hypothetical protein